MTTFFLSFARGCEAPVIVLLPNPTRSPGLSFYLGEHCYEFLPPHVQRIAASLKLANEVFSFALKEKTTMQRGRKSAHIIALRPQPTTRPRLTAPSTLTAAERAVFVETVAQYPHLKPGDIPMIAAFAQATVKTFKLAKQQHDVQAWERSARVMISFATKLRLTPQSHTRAEALGRKRYDQHQHGTGGDEQWSRGKGTADDEW